MANKEIRTDLGPVSAYAFAKRGGFEGTLDEFIKIIGSVCGNAPLIEQVKDEAVSAAALAKQSEDNARESANQTESLKNAVDTTKQYIDEVSENITAKIGDAEGYAAAASASADAASESEKNAGNYAAASTSSANAAKASEAAAAESAAAAKDSENKAIDYASSAKSAADEANTSAAAAANSETNAATSASQAAAGIETIGELERSASQSAINASQSAEAAATSETNAKASEASAKTAETNAKASEAAAAESAGRAATSENAAAASANAAKASEDIVVENAKQASLSETNAKSSADAALASEENAAASSLAAAESAENANTYKEAASQSAEEASQFSSAAESSSVSSAESAAAASASADAANASKEAAVQSESNASVSASAAAESAAASANSAQSAAQSADSASSSATMSENILTQIQSEKETATNLINSEKDSALQSIRDESNNQEQTLISTGSNQVTLIQQATTDATDRIIEEKNASILEIKDIDKYPPKVNEETGKWQTWNSETQSYEDTEIEAQGPQGQKGDPGESVPVVALDGSDAGKVMTVNAEGKNYELTGPYAPIEATIRPVVSGNPAICENGIPWNIQGLKIYGKSTQDGTPSPESPVPIVSAGENGQLHVLIRGAQLIDAEAFFTDPPVGLDVVKYYPLQVMSGTYTLSASYPATGNIANLFLMPGNVTSDASTNSNGVWNEHPTTLQASGGYVTIGLRTAHTDNPNNPLDFDIMLNYGTVALPWQPYQSQSLTLSTPSGLPGIPVDSGGNYTDASGQQLVCNYRDYNSEKDFQWIGKTVVDGSTIKFVVNSASTLFNLPSNSFPKIAYNAKFLCNYFPGDIFTSNSNYDFAFCCVERMKDFGINSDDEFNQLCQQWNSSGNPLTIYYTMDEPIESPIPTEELAAYRALQTYADTTVVSTAEPVAGIEAQYIVDPVHYIEQKDEENKTKVEASSNNGYVKVDGLEQKVYELPKDTVKSSIYIGVDEATGMVSLMSNE